MKHKKQLERLKAKQKAWENMSNKKGTKKPGSIKKP